MKKISLISLVSALMIFSCSAFAGSATFGSAVEATVNKSSLKHHVTDITVINASRDGIYTWFPYRGIKDYVRPTFNEHFWDDDPGIWTTRMVLQDAYQRTFLEADVCRLAIVTVYGYTGNFGWVIDSHLCSSKK
jgi:hypothetical protein